MAAAFPDRGARIQRVIDRLFDLHAVVRSHDYHPDLDGSFSLKALVPVLVPELTYGSIADGGDASAAYDELIRATTPAGRRSALARSLRRYCRTDTLALVELWRALEQRARAGAEVVGDRRLALPGHG